MPKLHQIIAIEEDLKNKTGAAVAVLEREVSQADNFNGLSRVYRPKDENGEQLPAESKRVQHDALKQIEKFVAAKSELVDLTATKDHANMGAYGSVEIDGKTLIENVPVTHLMFLAKQLEQFKSFVEKLPVLDTAEEWKSDPSTGHWRTDVTTRHRTEKLQEFKLITEATDKHPAQVAQLSKDVTIGYWDQTKLSAALPAFWKAALIKRIDDLIVAVKLARGRANEVDAVRQHIAEDLFTYLLNVPA